MKVLKIYRLSLMFLIILVSLPVFGETIILQSEKGKQHVMQQITSIYSRDILMGLNKQKLVHIRREEFDKPNHTISFLDETGNVYHSCICLAEYIILEADIYNEELYTLEAKCFPDYSTRKVKAIPHEDSIMEMPSREKREEQRKLPVWKRDVYKQHPRAWIEKMEIYIRKYNESNPQGETLLKLGSVTERYTPYRNRLIGLVMTNDQAKVIFFNRNDQSKNIEICGYPLDESEAPSSLKVPVEKDFPIYSYHDSKNMYLLDSSKNESDDYYCQLIQMNVETGEKEVIFNDINMAAYGIDGTGNVNYFSYYKDSGNYVYSVKKVSLGSPRQYIDKISIPPSFKFFSSKCRWDKQLEKFIIHQYKSSPVGPTIYDIYLLDLK